MKLKDRKNSSLRTKVKIVVSFWCGDVTDYRNVMFLHLLPKYPTGWRNPPARARALSRLLGTRSARPGAGNTAGAHAC